MEGGRFWGPKFKRCLFILHRAIFICAAIKKSFFIRGGMRDESRKKSNPNGRRTQKSAHKRAEREPKSEEKTKEKTKDEPK